MITHPRNFALSKLPEARLVALLWRRIIAWFRTGPRVSQYCPVCCARLETCISGHDPCHHHTCRSSLEVRLAPTSEQAAEALAELDAEIRRKTALRVIRGESHNPYNYTTEIRR